MGALGRACCVDTFALSKRDFPRSIAPGLSPPFPLEGLEMLVLGFNGGLDSESTGTRLPAARGLLHDSSAVLVSDGRVLAAVEEERLNRVKHSDHFPERALKSCLKQAGVSLSDLDAIAYCGNEQVLDARLGELSLASGTPLGTVREVLVANLQRVLGDPVEPGKLAFVPHHLAHSVSAFAQSGFENALSITLDGAGDDLAGGVDVVEKGRLRRLRDISIEESLGYFYLRAIPILGYEMFDEYKVMGLAPYGDPSRFRELFLSLYALGAEGRYTLHWPRFLELAKHCPPRAGGAPVEQVHKDFAASLQEALEVLVFHCVNHFAAATGEQNLCLSGGVAHNCTMTGKLLTSGTFRNIFVTPAAHDAGGALGAALHVDGEKRGSLVAEPLRQAFWGPTVGTESEISRGLMRWAPLVRTESDASIEEKAADAMARGQVLAWVRGGSEFGPRALGNRSILADPRPAENRSIINQMVKKREAFRPFAPAVLEEAVADYFEIPPHHQTLPFMNFVLKVRPERRAQLGAVTHVDGTARVQTVSKEHNPGFHKLISAFAKRTGVPILLNTSFNNNVEPVVQTLDEAVVTFLTTGLNHLVVGNHWVEKKPSLAWEDLLGFQLDIPFYVECFQLVTVYGARFQLDSYNCVGKARELKSFPVSEPAFHLLSQRGRGTLGARLDQLRLPGRSEREKLVLELVDLWANRLVVFNPPEASGPG
jgi:carbamoyltransferase